MAKQLCEGSDTADFESRPFPFRQTTEDRAADLARCKHCDRVLSSPKKNGRLRQHQPRGRTTASMDKTMDALWDAGRVQALLGAGGDATVYPDDRAELHE